MNCWTRRRKILKQVDRYVQAIEQSYSTSDQEEACPMSFNPYLQTHVVSKQPQLTTVNNELTDTSTTSVEIPSVSVTGEASQDEAILSDVDEKPSQILILSSEFSDTDDNDSNLASDLANWAVENRITHVALAQLLYILRKTSPDLPKDPRTLLGTNVKVVSKDTPAGQYYHLGPSFRDENPTPPRSRPGEHVPNVTATEKLMLQLLTDIRLSVRDLQVQMTNVLGSQQPDNLEIDYAVPDGLTIPVGNKKELDQLEEALGEKPEFQKYLINSLASRGGHNIPDCVKRMLSGLITNSLMKEMNWTGQGGKIEFQKLKIKMILQRAIQRNTVTQLTDYEVQGAVSRFLKGAVDREGGRRKRQRLHEQTAGEII